MPSIYLDHAIYLDYGATTPIRPEAIAAVTEVLTSTWGNPSSIHRWGERSAYVLERARLQVAELIHADPHGIIFTSGGTEADNLAILGIARRYGTPQHLVISAVEHSAIARPAELLERAGWAVTRLPVDRHGRVDPQDLRRTLQPNTVLVSVIYGQNEVGTIQPIDKLGQICRAAGVLFHTDAVQAAGRIPLDVQTLPVDLLSMSAHKIYGMQGAGALYVRPDLELVPLPAGGGQERGLRSGTQPVAAIAGFGTAAALAQLEMPAESARLASLRDRLIDLVADIPDLVLTGALPGDRLPHHVSFCHSHVQGRDLVRSLSDRGIGISSGSACSSGTIAPSAALLAMGYSPEQALGSIRFTLGRDTTVDDMNYVSAVLHEVLP